MMSRRYIQHGIVELAMLQKNGEPKPSAGKFLEEILTTKPGLFLSAVGMII